MSDTRTRNPRGAGRQLRQELLDATEALLAEEGDERQVTVRSIVDRVGVTPPSLYLHFPTKEDLVSQVVLRAFGALAQAIGSAVAGPAQRGDGAEALRAGCLAYLAWSRANPGTYAVIFQARRETEVGLQEGSTATAAFEGLAEGIAACQEEGSARPGDPREMATLVWASLHGIASLTELRKEFPWPSDEEMVDQLLDGLVGTGT